MNQFEEVASKVLEQLDDTIQYGEGVDIAWYAYDVGGTNYGIKEAKHDLLSAHQAEVRREQREAKIEAAMYFKKYMISNSPFIEEILNPYLATLQNKKEAIKKHGGEK